MSRHWKPEEIARARQARLRKSWPEGATAGLLLLATACVGVAVTLYWVAGPSDVFAEDRRVD